MKKCVHCGQRIIKVNYALGEKWMHQIQGAAFEDSVYEFCKATAATPPSEGAIIIVHHDS